MKPFEKILDTVCVITTVAFFLSCLVMVLAQGFAIVTLNGELATTLLNTISKPAGIVSAVTVVTAIILGYMRGQMKG
ncbi:MAG: hypothetical protein IJ374_11145 [Lachnospiraceae bacterium]|nr:hypothetical protein [Lachnospiraceae bacterium]